MGTSFTEVMDVKIFLRQQHILASEEWIEACIHFIKQDQGNHTISSQNLKKNVYDQWLLADLEEILCPSLPQDLLTAQKITIRESFALQVQGIRDISRPAYAQLKQLTNYTNENEEFSTDPKAPVPEWEAKPTRMLMLNLTDGCTQMQGMEYKPISFLSPNFPPGIKVLIKGPVDCRFGVFLLTSENISILGGEVESKRQQFSRESILKQQLHIEDDDPSEDAPATNSTVTSSTNSSVTPSTNSSVTPSTNSTNNNQEFSIPQEPSIRNSYPSVISRNQPDSRNGRSHSFPSNNLRNLERNTEDILEHFESDDDFDQNLDLGMLEEIENSQRQISETTASAGDDFDECDMWQEDEDVLRDLLEFQDTDPEFKMPFEVDRASGTSSSAGSSYSANEVFTYLSTVVNDPSANCTITIKGFIVTVLSKLGIEQNCWSICVKINDGTATVDAKIHDKILEEIIGISAQDMRKMPKEVIQRELMQKVVSTVKLALLNYNCLMDVKFTPGEKPCIVKCSQLSKHHIQQLLERVRSRF